MTSVSAKMALAFVRTMASNWEVIKRISEIQASFRSNTGSIRDDSY